jgi:hypothetical protein
MDGCFYAAATRASLVDADAGSGEPLPLVITMARREGYQEVGRGPRAGILRVLVMHRHARSCSEGNGRPGEVE